MGIVRKKIDVHRTLSNLQMDMLEKAKEKVAVEDEKAFGVPEEEILKVKEKLAEEKEKEEVDEGVDITVHISTASMNKLQGMGDDYMDKLNILVEKAINDPDHIGSVML